MNIIGCWKVAKQADLWMGLPRSKARERHSLSPEVFLSLNLRLRDWLTLMCVYSLCFFFYSPLSTVHRPHTLSNPPLSLHFQTLNSQKFNSTQLSSSSHLSSQISQRKTHPHFPSFHSNPFSLCFLSPTLLFSTGFYRNIPWTRPVDRFQDLIRLCITNVSIPILLSMPFALMEDGLSPLISLMYTTDCLLLSFYCLFLFKLCFLFTFLFRI